MKRYFLIGIAFGVLFSSCSAISSEPRTPARRSLGEGGSMSGIKAEPNDANKAVSDYLQKLNNRTRSLESYQCRIEYLFEQPVFETKTLQTGVLYYQKDSGKSAYASSSANAMEDRQASADKSALRINFRTRREDEEKEQKYQDEYIFDGIWLTHIDYQVKEVKRYQQTKENESVDAFDLVAKNFPILGFSKVEELEKNYDIKLLEKENACKSTFGGLVGFSLSPKPDSEYLMLRSEEASPLRRVAKDYKTINFWVDSSIDLPAKIVATNADGDIYQVRFLEPKINQKIDKKIFEYKVPKGFTVEINKLNEESK